MKKIKSIRRQPSGFVLIGIIIFSLAAIAMLFTIFPLIDSIQRLEGYGRNTLELRNAAESGIDYCVEQINLFAAANPGFNSPIINSGTVIIPPAYTIGLANGSVTAQVRSVSASDWGVLSGANGSSMYSTDIANLGQYLVLESKAHRGLLTKTVRVFLEPTCNVQPGEMPLQDFSPTMSYFDKPFCAALDITSTSNLSISGSTTADLDVTAGGSIDDKITVSGDKHPLTTGLKFAPIPTPGITSPLPTTGTNSSLTAGSYVGSNISFNGSNSASIASNVSSPVKIFVQDGVRPDGTLPSTVVSIDASALKNNSTPQNLQLWYSGNRDIQINLDADFSGTIFAPNSQVTLLGASDFNGALVGKNIILTNTGNMTIEANLADKNNSNGSSGLLYTGGSNTAVVHGYKAVSWQDLSAAP